MPQNHDQFPDFPFVIAGGQDTAPEASQIDFDTSSEGNISVSDGDTTDSHLAVTLDDVAGILGKNWTGGLDSVDAIRRQRDDPEYLQP